MTAHCSPQVLADELDYQRQQAWSALEDRREERDAQGNLIAVWVRNKHPVGPRVIGWPAWMNGTVMRRVAP